MRAILILAAAIALATPAFSQTDQGAGDQARSDQYACNHGAPDDPRTIDACARLRGGEGGETATPPEQAAPTQPAAPNGTGAYPYPTPRYTPPHYTPPADQDEVATNAALAAKAAKVGQSEAAKAEHPAAPPPTDVGEAPLNADEQANESSDNSDDEGGTGVHFGDGHWLAGLGAFAIGLIILASLIILPLHFLPTIIAIAGHRRNTLWIFVLNLFFGWTIIGWIVALVWALASDRER
ncbi:MAG: superinfection immunity protein [Caulobacteraceae bacterium]|jgi:hypothetical protein